MIFLGQTRRGWHGRLDRPEQSVSGHEQQSE